MRSPHGPVLYLDVDGVLQYAKADRWVPRPDAGEFLAWAVTRFQCRWLTNWTNPNLQVPRELKLAVPPGIVEVNWRTGSIRQPFKAAAIDYEEDWLWLEDAPSEFDLAELKKRGQMERLIKVPPHKEWVLNYQIRPLLEERWLERPA